MKHCCVAPSNAGSLYSVLSQLMLRLPGHNVRHGRPYGKRKIEMPHNNGKSLGRNVVTFDDMEISKWSDALVLRLVADFYEENTRVGERKHLVDICSAIGCTTQCYRNYMAGKGALNTAQWVKLFTLTNSPLIPAYLSFRFGAMLKRIGARMNETQEKFYLYPLTKAAKAIGVNFRTLRYWMDEGAIGFVRVGTHKRIPKAELERFVAARTETMTNAALKVIEGGHRSITKWV
jgi:excisionase family DNA binding protein